MTIKKEKQIEKKKRTKKEIVMQVTFADAKSVTNMCEYERELERKRILELIDEVDLELAIATSIMDTKTKKKMQIPEEINPILNNYWDYIKKLLKRKINKNDNLQPTRKRI